MQNTPTSGLPPSEIAPPIVVRRLRDGYLLVDGLYRLRAAQAVGMARVAAVVEG